MRQFVLCLVAALLLASCETPTQDPKGSNSDGDNSSPTLTELNAVIKVASNVPDVTPDSQLGAPVVTDSADGNYRSTTTTTTTHNSLDEIFNMGLNDNTVYPGATLRGDKLSSYVYEPIALERAPMTLSLGGLEGAKGLGKLSRVVQDPNDVAQVRQGISNLIDGAFKDTNQVGAKAEFTKATIKNKTDFSLALKANLDFTSGSVKSNFDFTKKASTTRVMGVYKQVYFSVDMSRPKTPGEIFASSVTAEQAQQVLEPGSFPVYVSGVNYGMMAFICVESNDSETDVNAALQGAYDSGAVEGSASFTLKMKEVLSNATINTFVYGGSTSALGTVDSGYAGFVKIIKSSANFGAKSPGLPLTYKFANLSNNVLAKVAMTQQYATVETIPLKEKFRVTLQKIHFDSCDDGIGDSTNEMKWLQAYVTPVQKSVTGAETNGAEVTVFALQNTSYWSVSAGSEWTNPNLTTTFVLNTDPKLYSAADCGVTFRTVGEDHDSGSGNDTQQNYSTIRRSQFLNADGSAKTHEVRGDGSEYTSGWYFTIEKIAL